MHLKKIKYIVILFFAFICLSFGLISITRLYESSSQGSVAAVGPAIESPLPTRPIITGDPALSYDSSLDVHANYAASPAHIQAKDLDALLDQYALNQQRYYFQPSEWVQKIFLKDGKEGLSTLIESLSGCDEAQLNILIKSEQGIERRMHGVKILSLVADLSEDQALIDMALEGLEGLVRYPISALLNDTAKKVILSDKYDAIEYLARVSEVSALKLFEELSPPERKALEPAIMNGLVAYGLSQDAAADLLQP